MKTIIKYKIPYLVIAAFLLLAGCSKHVDYKYRVRSLKLHNQDNSGDTITNKVDTIPAKAYGIRIEYAVTITSTDGTVKYESGFSLDGRVTSFNVYSLTDFDSIHPALSSLNDYFLYGGDTIKYAIRDNTMFQNAGNRNALAETDTSWANNYMTLMILPKNPGFRNFVVNASFDDGTKLTDTIGVTLF